MICDTTFLSDLLRERADGHPRGALAFLAMHRKQVFLTTGCLISCAREPASTLKSLNDRVTTELRVGTRRSRPVKLNGTELGICH